VGVTIFFLLSSRYPESCHCTLNKIVKSKRNSLDQIRQLKGKNKRKGWERDHKELFLGFQFEWEQLYQINIASGAMMCWS